MTVWAAALGLTLTGFAVGCDGKGQVIDVDGRRPEKPAGTCHVSWSIMRRYGTEEVSCGDARAGQVVVHLARADHTQPRTYRAACDLPAHEAWIPVPPGAWLIRAELVDRAGQPLAATPERPIEIRSTDGQLTMPVLFQVR